MSYLDQLLLSLKETVPLFIMVELMMLPFILLERWKPAGVRPTPDDYWPNVLIAGMTNILSLPIGMVAAAAGAQTRQALHLHPWGFTLHKLGAIPVVGDGLEIIAVVAATLFLHDLWFYWAHRIEHSVPFLWEFHKLHHSDTRMNVTTWSRDHFLQDAWRTIFSTFTVGLLLDLSVREAGQAGLYIVIFTCGWSMFYHSAVRIRLPWLDRVLVTPQVHRIHHSEDPAHHNRNFADYLPVFDIVFGTYHPPQRDEFPSTGLGNAHPPPRGVLAAQLRPVGSSVRVLVRGLGRFTAFAAAAEDRAGR